MKEEIKASFTGIICTVSAGIVAAGSSLFTTEFMKMYVNENSPIPGVFEAVIVAGSAVIAGETIIGYFTPDE